MERAQHAQFVHRAVIDDAQDHLDFVLSLKPDLVYALKQLWSAYGNNPCEFLRRLCDIAKYDRSGTIPQNVAEWRRRIDPCGKCDESARDHGAHSAPR